MDGQAAGRYPCFEGIRAFAALAIIVFHAVFFTSFFEAPGGRFFWNLNAGVWVFFVASGFLLYRPFAASHLVGAHEVDVRRYALRRVTRLYPAYWLVLIFFTFVVPRIQFFGFADVVRNITLTQTYVPTTRNPFAIGLPVAWSLVVEVTFYAFLPIYAAVIGRFALRHPSRAVELIGGGALFAIGLAAIIAVASGYTEPWITILPQHLPAFAVGILLAVVATGPWDRRASDRLRRWGDRTWAWWGAALVVFLAIPIVGGIEALDPEVGFNVVAIDLSRTAIGLLLVVPAVLGTQDRGLIRRLLRSRVLVFLGLVSYGLFLWHWFLLRVVQEDVFDWRFATGSWWKLFIVTLPLVVIAASASWYLLERPLQRAVRATGSRLRPAPGPRPVDRER